MNRGQQSSIVASPVLVGAVTALLAVIAVFLAYNANAGLPFVPTYDISAHVPDAAGLVVGNEVRVGGKRVGVIKDIEARKTSNGEEEANLSLSLQTSLKPLRDDSQITVRPRSPLGLKYLELVRGTRGKPIASNGVLPLRQAQPIVELDQVVNAFDNATRRAARGTVEELGNATAGRGADFNETLAVFPPLLGGATRVASNLADPRTNLAGLLHGFDLTLGEVDPVAAQLGSFVTASSITLGALASVSPQLADSIAETPSTEVAGIRALRAARPVLTDAARLVHDIRPAAPLLRPATEKLDRALDTGIPVLSRATSLSDRLKSTLTAVRDLSADGDTRDTLRRLLTAIVAATELTDYTVPAQTQCTGHPRGLDAQRGVTTSEGDAGGTWFRTVVGRRSGRAPGEPTAGHNLHNDPYPNTAAPGQDGDCEAGNEGYAPGRVSATWPGDRAARPNPRPPPGRQGPWPRMIEIAPPEPRPRASRRGRPDRIAPVAIAAYRQRSVRRPPVGGRHELKAIVSPGERPRLALAGQDRRASQVGRVDEIERGPGNTAIVTMAIKKHGLPIHPTPPSRCGRASSSRATSSST